MRKIMKIALAWLGRFVRAAVLVGAWNGIVAGCTVLAYRMALDFDAASRQSWEYLLSLYEGGAVLNFLYLEIGGYGVLAALFGSLLLAIRSGSLWERLPSPASYLPEFAAWRLTVPARRPVSLSRLKGLAARAAPATAATAAPPEATAADGAGGHGPQDRGEARVDPSVAPPGPPAGGAAPPPVPVPGADAVAEAPADAAPEGDSRLGADAGSQGGEDAGEGNGEGEGDGDGGAGEDAEFTALSRAVALVEVWSSPPPEWMVLALRDELEQLSPAGWGFLEVFGASALDLIDVIADLDIAPSAAGVAEVYGEVRDRLLATYRPPAVVPEDTFGPPAVEAADADGEPAGPVQGMTLCASWFSEVIENFMMLEELRAGADALPAGQFEAQWGPVHEETLEQLGLAHRAMTEADWISLDQYPDRAQRARILLDRLAGDTLLPQQKAEEASWPATLASPFISGSRPEPHSEPASQPAPEPEAVAFFEEAMPPPVLPSSPRIDSLDDEINAALVDLAVPSAPSASRPLAAPPVAAPPVAAPPVAAPPVAAPGAVAPPPPDVGGTMRRHGFTVTPFGLAPGCLLARRDGAVFLVATVDLGGVAVATDGGDGEWLPLGAGAAPRRSPVAEVARMVRLAETLAAQRSAVSGVVVVVNGALVTAADAVDRWRDERGVVVCTAGPAPVDGLAGLEDLIAASALAAPAA